MHNVVAFSFFRGAHQHSNAFSGHFSAKFSAAGACSSLSSSRLASQWRRVDPGEWYRMMWNVRMLFLLVAFVIRVQNLAESQIPLAYRAVLAQHQQLTVFI